MALPVVVRGAANDLAVQLSTTGYGLPLELSTLPGALPVRVVTDGGVPCLDPLGTVFGGGGTVGLDFSQAANSQYLPLFAGFL